MSDKSGPEEAVEGVVEGVKGKVKEVAGAVAGRDDLMREGQAQQDKADAQREAAQKEAEAESARKAADINEARQKAAVTTSATGGSAIQWVDETRRRRQAPAHLPVV